MPEGQQWNVVLIKAMKGSVRQSVLKVTADRFPHSLSDKRYVMLADCVNNTLSPNLCVIDSCGMILDYGVHRSYYRSSTNSCLCILQCSADTPLLDLLA